MSLISTLKRAKYFGVVLVLVLAAMPISPIATWVSDTVSALTAEGEVETLEELLDAVTAGGTVKLANDITRNTTDAQVVVDSSKNVTLDLNGHTLSLLSNGARGFINRGTLTITGNGTITNGTVANSAYGLIDNYGTIVVENGTFIDYGEGDGSSIKNRPGSNASLTINAGTFEGRGVNTGNACIYSDGELVIKDGVHFTNASNRAYAVIVNSGTATIGETVGNDSNPIVVEGTHGALSVSSGTVVINNGIYTAANYYGIWITNDGSNTDVTINYGDFTGGSIGKYGLLAAVDDGWQDNSDITVTVNDGKFTGYGDAAAMRINKGTSTRTWNTEVSGGEFSTDPDSSYLAANKISYLLANGDYEVGDAPVTTAVPPRVLARVGQTVYVDGLTDDAIQNHSQFSGDNGTTFVKPNEIKATKAGLSHAKIEFDIYNGDGSRNTSYDKLINVHAYVANDIGAIYMTEGAVNDNLALQFSVNGNTYDTLEVKTSDANTATIVDNGDGTYTLTAMKGGMVNIEGKVTINSTDHETTGWMTLGTVYVWNFEHSSESRFDIARGGSLTLTAKEAFGQSSVSCKLGSSEAYECNGFAGLGFTDNQDGTYTFTTDDNTATGKYVVRFHDVINNNEVDHYYTDVVVHDITTSVNEEYVVKGESKTITATAAYNTGGVITAKMFDATGTSETTDAAVTQDGDTFTVSVEKGGQYVLRFYDSLTDGTEIMTKDVTIYGVNFNVTQTNYHLKKGGFEHALIYALHEYWGDLNGYNDANNGVLYNSSDPDKLSITGTDTITADGRRHLVLPEDGLEAGDYTMTFTALVKGAFQLPKIATIHVYEMTSNAVEKYYGEAGDTFNVAVGDKNQNAYTKVTVAGPDGGLTFETDAEGKLTGDKVTAVKPGEYTVTWTDYMANDTVVDSCTSTFKIYGLDVSLDGVADGGVTTAGTNVNVKFVPENTYGQIETTIKKDGVKIGETHVGTNDIAVDTTAEGKYTVSVKNISSGKHNMPENEKFTFYVMNPADFEMAVLKSGKTLKTTTEHTVWKTDFIQDDRGRSLGFEVADDGTITVDTTGLSLGMHTLRFGHKFGRDQATIKRVFVAVYDVNADPETDAEKITETTIDKLLEDLVKTESLEEMSVILADVLGEEWMSTYGNLEMALLTGQTIDTRVEVKKATDVSDKMKAAVAELGADGVEYYDINVLMSANGAEIGKLHHLSSKITVAVAKVSNPAAGYTRKYVILREHNGKVTEMKEGRDFYIKDGILYVMSDEFSVYAVTYKDTLIPKAPDTGDEVADTTETASVNVSTAVVVAIAAMVLAGAAIFAKRK